MRTVTLGEYFVTSSEAVVSNYAIGLILRTNGARETLKTIMQTPEESSWSAFNVDPIVSQRQWQHLSGREICILNNSCQTAT